MGRELGQKALAGSGLGAYGFAGLNYTSVCTNNCGEAYVRQCTSTDPTIWAAVNARGLPPSSPTAVHVTLTNNLLLLLLLSSTVGFSCSPRRGPIILLGRRDQALTNMSYEIPRSTLDNPHRQSG